MSFNSTCQSVLSCGDSELSTTASVTGIFTFFYAIIITLVYRTRKLGNAKEDIGRFLKEIEREYRAADSLRQRVRNLHETYGVAPNYEDRINDLFLEADRIFNSSVRLVELFARVGSRRWQLMLARGRFIARRAEIQHNLDELLQIRSRLETILGGWESSILLENVYKQSRVLDNYCTIIESQRMMLRRIMNTLHLDNMEGPSARPLKDAPEEPGGDLSQESLAEESQDKLASDPGRSSENLVIRPPTRWDPPGPQNS